MATKEKDYRVGQKVIATIELEDQGQDITELDVLENGVVLGYSIMFENGKRSLLGIGTNDGMEYHNGLKFMEVDREKLIGLTVYLYDTDKKKPLPWNAYTLKYAITKVGLPVKANRFIKK